MAIVDLALEEDVGYSMDYLQNAVKEWAECPDWGAAAQKMQLWRGILLNAARGRQARAAIGPKLAFDRRNVTAHHSFIPEEYVRAKVAHCAVKMKGWLAMKSNGGLPSAGELRHSPCSRGR